MASYVDRWHLGGSFPPFTARDVRLYGFALRADARRLAEVATRDLNAPHRGGRTTSRLGGEHE